MGHLTNMTTDLIKVGSFYLWLTNPFLITYQIDIINISQLCTDSVFLT